MNVIIRDPLYGDFEQEVADGSASYELPCLMCGKFGTRIYIRSDEMRDGKVVWDLALTNWDEEETV